MILMLLFREDWKIIIGISVIACANADTPPPPKKNYQLQIALFVKSIKCNALITISLWCTLLLDQSHTKLKIKNFDKSNLNIKNWIGD